MQDDLIKDWLPLVHLLVHKMVKCHDKKEDCYGAGVLALVKAARSFKSHFKVPFKTFAAQRIRWAILDEIRRLDFVPRKVRRNANKNGQEIPAMFLHFEEGELENFTDPNPLPDAEVQSMDIQRLIGELLTQLTGRERYILSQLFYWQLNPTEIARLVKLTPSRICQIREDAFAKMKSIILNHKKYKELNLS